jgi:hypothetical protein
METASSSAAPALQSLAAERPAGDVAKFVYQLVTGDQRK